MPLRAVTANESQYTEAVVWNEIPGSDNTAHGAEEGTPPSPTSR